MNWHSMKINLDKICLENDHPSFEVSLIEFSIQFMFYADDCTNSPEFIKTKLTMSTSSIWGPQTLQNSSLSGCLCTICNMLLITLDKTCNSDKHFLWDILHGTADPNLVGKKIGLLSYHLYRSSFEH